MKEAPTRRGSRLLLVDDHTTVREGLKHILAGSDMGWTVARTRRLP